MKHNSMDTISIKDYPESINWRAKRLATLWFRTNNPALFSNKYQAELFDFYHFIGLSLDLYDKTRYYYKKIYCEE